MELEKFLSTVITAKEGWLNLCHSNEDGSDWTEEWYNYPNELQDAVTRANGLKDKNVYFSPYLFSKRSSTRDSAIVGRTIVADLDEANMLTIKFRPTVLVETSEHRHQGYWILDEAEELDRAKHEQYSKRLTYSIPGCDRTGWFISKRVRVPGTINYKYSGKTQTVTVVNVIDRHIKLSELEGLPAVPSKNGTDEASDEIIAKAMKIDSGPQEYLAKVQSKLPPKVVNQYNYEATDRSAALWALTTSGFRAGLSTEQVFFLARGSANNKFTSLRFNGDKELLKDVLRAKAEVHSGHNRIDLSDKIAGIRRHGGVAHEKNKYIAEMIRADMLSSGQFINCMDGTSWYIDGIDGRPVALVTRSESLQNMISNRYGLNPVERESSYVIASLISYTSTLAQVGRLGSLSYYDTDTNTLLLHTGRKNVLRITPYDITTVTNGYDSIVFPWSNSQEVIDPYFKHSGEPWDDLLFDTALNNIVGLKKSEAKALLKVWLLMLLLRNVIVSRPILAIFGQPGAGKSTLFRRIYTLLFGRGRSLSSITTADNFDFATAADPLVVFDNVDTWERWLPDRLALAAAISDITKRKLYTNNEVVTLTRQAFLGITAHNPKFGREDVTDRLVLLTLERLKEFTSETEIINYIFRYRSAIWGMLIQDVQKILATKPPSSGYPQFRIEDFSKYGMWIGNAVGCGKEFGAALTNIASEQKAFSIEEDQIVIDAIGVYINRKKGDSDFKPPSEWWGLLETCSRDPLEFKKKYNNAVVLGKKFWTLQDTLKSMLVVEWEYDAVRGSRVWRFLPKSNGTTEPKIAISTNGVH